MPIDSQTIILIIGGLWLALVTFLVVRLLLHYQRLTKNVSQKDLISALNQLISQTKENKEGLDHLSQQLKEEIESGRSHFQKIGFKRFNPFTDTGGDQSFCLALLDENDTGIVISSLHSRENTRIYAKKINQGKPVNNQVLSQEEQSVIKQAQTGK